MLRQFVDRFLFLMGKGEANMVTVYVTLIIKGYKTFAQVPVNLQPAVEAELEALGLGTDGKPFPEA
jgi:hypothetical protein